MCDVGLGQQRPTGVASIVDELIVATVNLRIYSSEHPRVRHSIDTLVTLLEDHFATSNHDRLRVGYVDGYLIHQGAPLLGVTLSAPRLIKALETVGSGGIEIERRARRHELTSLIEFLSGTKVPVPYWQVNAGFEAAGCHHVRLLAQHGWGSSDPVDGQAPGEQAPEKDEHELEIPVTLYQSLMDSLQGISISVCRGEVFGLEALQGQMEAILHALDADPKTMLNLARYEQYDAFTFGHSVRVCVLALQFARALTKDVELQNRIGVAALLHDVGKARVPFEILHSRSRLTPDERREMQRHAVYGARILLELDRPDPMAVTTAFGHHRTLDSKGYPTTAHNLPLSMVTRIVKVCDVYEALTAVRPYKPAMSPCRAYRVMASMGANFVPGLLKRFIEVNGIFPIGTLVKLNTGEIAMVERQTTDLRQPVVQLQASPEGSPLHAEDRAVVELGAPNTPDQRWIVIDKPTTRGEPALV
jgi:putative nucleotidyltransferase with HDIG domain